MLSCLSRFGKMLFSILMTIQIITAISFYVSFEDIWTKVQTILNFIEAVTKSVCSGRAKNFFWWDSLEIGEKIPNNCAFAVAGEINYDDMSWGKDEG